MRRPRAHLREDPLRRVGAPKTSAPPAGDLARRLQPTSMQIARANGAELTFRRVRLPKVEHTAPEVAGAPALDRAVVLAHATGELPTHRHINERAVRRVRVCAPTDDRPTPLPNGAVVPRPCADVGVAAFGDVAQLSGVAAPATDYAIITERALVLAPRIKRQIAASGAGRSGLRDGQERNQQRDDRKPDQEGFTPPPPPPIG